jgi:solute carrier family 25 carnitine/acylcarnitine transporter 20/29
MALPVAAQAVYKGTVFTVNNVAQDFLLGHRTLENHKLGRIMDGELTFMDRFASGCIGGAVNAWLFVTPVELVRNQMIAMATASAPSPSPSSSSQPRPGFNSAAVLRRPASFRRQWQSSPPSSWGVIQSSVRNHGISSLWRGASWSVARDGWGCGWFFVAMHYAQERLTRDLDDGSPPGLGVRIVSGGMAGLAYWVAALPLDTVKTWVQSADLRHGSLSVAESIRSIQRREGATGVVRQLFRGWQVAYGRGIPSAAITMIVYSWTFDQLQQSSHRSTMSGAV